MRKLSFLSFLVGFFALLSSSFATIVVQLDDEQMTAKADQILHAKVVRKVSSWDSKDRRIYTYITLASLESLKGSPSSEVVIRQVGGSTNTYGTHVPGSASFFVGEEVFVFLEKQHDPRFFHVIGMAAGKWSVSTHALTQERRLHRNLSGVAFAEWNSNGTFKIHDHKAHAKEKTSPAPLLSDFIKRIRHYVQNPRPLAPIPGMRTQPFPTLPPAKR